MAQLDIYVRSEDKTKLMRKAYRMHISLSKLMVSAALQYELPIVEDKECVEDGKQ